MTGPDADRAVAVRSAFDELGRISFADHSLESLLNAVTVLAGRVLPAEPVISVTIVQDGRPATVASSGALATELDGLQYRLGSGPCLAAATTGEPSQILDTRNAATWTELAAAAARRGCDTMLSVPLPAPEPVSGALNVYARRSDTLSRETRDLVTRFAAYAVVPVSNMYLYHRAVEQAEHLRAALDSRAVIDQAKGILMERYKLTADRAFQALARVSMESNTKVRDVAQRMVESADLDGP